MLLQGKALSFVASARKSSNWANHLLKVFTKSSNNIQQIGDPILRKQARKVELAALISTEFQDIIHELVSTMRKNNAAGIAAPQIGYSMQVIALEVTGNDLKLAMNKYGSRGVSKMQMSLFPLKILINPKLKIIDPTHVTFREGCLSMKYFSAMVPRAKEVEIQALNEHGDAIKFQAHGWTARILQHEMDHLQGNLFVDSMMYKSLANEKWKIHS